MVSVAAFKNDALLPRSRDGLGRGAVLALGVHLGLVFALTAAVKWRTHTPDVVSAELWASVPELAAPPAPAPVPAPPPPPPAVAAPVEPPRPKVDIAVEREKAARERAEKAEAERLKKEAEDKRKRDAAEKKEREAAEQQARTEAARQDTLRRMMSQAGAVAASGVAPGSAARDAAPSASYTARLVALIRGNTVFSGEVTGNPAAEVEVRAAASGTIISRRLLKSSGNAAWDEAVLRGIDKTGALPRDTDGRVPSTVIVSFRPKDQ